MRQVASEREARWAQEPLPAPGSKVEQARAAARAQAASEGRSFDDELSVQDAEEKEPHNAIERRYRNNINDRIAILRNAVPALRDVRPIGEQGGRRKRGSRAKNKPAQFVDGISLATKLNKATILTKSTEYIYYLKRRETDLLLEIEGYKELIRSFQRGEELLDIWLKEMQCVKQERDAEKAALTPQGKKTSQGSDDPDADADAANPAGDASLDLEPLVESMDEEHGELGSELSSPQAFSVPDPASASSTGSAGMYMMAAFLGITWVDNSVWQAPSPSSPEDTSHLQSLLSCVRVWLGIACAVVLFVPFWTRGLTRIRQRYLTPRSAPMERTAREALLAKLATPRTPAADTDAALRVYLGAPRSSLAAIGGAILEFVLLTLPDRCLATLSPPSPTPPPTETATEGSGAIVGVHGVSDVPSQAWLRLLELETSVGPFAVPALSLRVHTLLSALRRTRLHRLHNPATHPLSTLRTEATAALALGRMAKTEHSFGRWLRSLATSRWDELRVLVAHANSHAHLHDAATLPAWLKAVLALDFDSASAMVPSRTALASATAAASAATVSAYLATPLLVMSSKMHMATLQRIWTYLFAALVHAPAPRTLSWRTDWDALDDGFDGDDAWDLEGGVSLRAFLAEFAMHVGATATTGTDTGSSGADAGAGAGAGAFLRPLSLSVLESPTERAAMEHMIVDAEAATAPGTSAHLAARLTRITWTFLLASASAHCDRGGSCDQGRSTLAATAAAEHAQHAQQQVLALVAHLALMPPACPAATLAVDACARLVLGHSAGAEVAAFLPTAAAATTSAVGEEDGTMSTDEHTHAHAHAHAHAEADSHSDDARIFALIRATVGWAGLLRELARALGDSRGNLDAVLLRHPHPPAGSTGSCADSGTGAAEAHVHAQARALLAPTLELRRVLAHTMIGDGAEAHSFGPARDTCIDVLTHLCYCWTSPEPLTLASPASASSDGTSDVDVDGAGDAPSYATDDSLADSLVDTDSLGDAIGSASSPASEASDWGDELCAAATADADAMALDACRSAWAARASEKPCPVLAGYTRVADAADAWRLPVAC